MKSLKNKTLKDQKFLIYDFEGVADIFIMIKFKQNNEIDMLTYEDEVGLD